MSSHLKNAERITLLVTHTEVPRSRVTLCTLHRASKYGWAGVLTQPYIDNSDALTQSHAIKADELDASSTNKADGTPQMIFHPLLM